MTQIAGAACLLTGAASGIGRALACELARRGCSVALADRDVAGLESLACELGGLSDTKMSVHTVDVVDRRQMEALAAAAISAHPNLNILINNAGVALLGQFHEIELADMQWLMDINFWGVVHGTRFLLPHLTQQREAHIVNLSSIFGIIAPPGQTAYAAAKFAVRGFSEALRHELDMARSPVRLSVVHPGGVATSIARNSRVGGLVMDHKRREESIGRFERLAQTTPEVAARRILDGIERNRPRILIGTDARRADLVQRLLPASYWKLIARSLERAAGRSKPRKAVSWRARVLDAIFRWGMKRHGDKPIDLERSRRMMRKPPRRALRMPADMQVTEVDTEDGLRFDKIERVESGTAKPAVIVYYLHGGGYFFGSPKTHRPIIVALAKVFECPAYALDYRLAPEHPFPAAVEDAAVAYRWLLAKHPHSRIVIAGDSAGGSLGIVTALGARIAGLRSPAALIAFSPWSDLACTGASIALNAQSCAMFTPKGIRQAAALYLAGSDPRDPRASPLYGNLAGLPPILLFASNHETLLDDSVRLAERARAVGVEVELVRRDGLPHVWPIFVHLLPEAREATATISAFARRLTLVSVPGGSGHGKRGYE